MSTLLLTFLGCRTNLAQFNVRDVWLKMFVWFETEFMFMHCLSVCFLKRFAYYWHFHYHRRSLPLTGKNRYVHEYEFINIKQQWSVEGASTIIPSTQEGWGVSGKGAVIHHILMVEMMNVDLIGDQTQKYMSDSQCVNPR